MQKMMSTWGEVRYTLRFLGLFALPAVVGGMVGFWGLDGWPRYAVTGVALVVAFGLAKRWLLFRRT